MRTGGGHRDEDRGAERGCGGKEGYLVSLDDLSLE